MTRPAIPWWRSLGAKIAVAVAAVTFAVVAPVSIYVDHQSAVDARERLRIETLNRLDTAGTLFRSFGRLRYAATTDPALVPSQLRGVGVGQQLTFFDGTEMWAAERITRHEILAVRTSATSLVEQRLQLQRTLLVAGVAALLLGAGLGWLAGSRLSLRARRGAAAARRIAASEKGVVAAQPGGDEIAALTLAVDQLADTLNRRIDREQAFTAYAAHELRTPVTALVSASELLPGDEVGGLVRGQVERLRALVSDLLEISRADAGEPAETVAMESEEAVRASLAASAATGVTATVARSAPVLVEQRRLDRILANLVANGVRHGAPPISVTVCGPLVRVDDAGPGFPDWLLEGGPRRFRADGPARGHGLGLSIVEAQATAIGATLAFSNRPPDGADPGGGRVELRLAEPPSARSAPAGSGGRDQRGRAPALRRIGARPTASGTQPR